MTHSPAGAPLPNLALIDQAQQAIADFEHSVAPGMWPYLDKATLVAEMRARIAEPFQINQGKVVSHAGAYLMNHSPDEGSVTSF